MRTILYAKIFLACEAVLGVAGGLGGRTPTVTHWYFAFRPLIRSSHFKMYKLYCQQIFPFVLLLYRRFFLLALSFNLIMKSFPSSMQSTFSKHSSNLSLVLTILNLYDENLTSL